MALGSPALLLAPMVDSSVDGHGYYSYFLIPKCVYALAARLVQRLLFGRLWGDMPGHKAWKQGQPGSHTPLVDFSCHVLPGNIPKSCRLHNNTVNSQLL